MKLYGFYGVSWGFPGTPAQQIARQRLDLTAAADAGCSLAHLSHLGNVKATRQLLDLAWSRGMSVILEDLGPDDVRTLASHPALLAHSVADDANARPLASVQAMCSAETLTPRYLSHGPTLDDSQAELYPLAEIIGVQSYVYPNEQLLASYRVWTQARSNADAAEVRVFGNSQLRSIGWGAPTAEQIRAQVWVAAATGLDGLLGYAQLDKNGTIGTGQSKAFTQACAEVNALTSGRAQVALSPDSLTLTANWRAGVSVQVDLSEKAHVLNIKRR
ncbi:hypothetical protein [Deinococcus ruber]|uniref:Uncharacterized protein n=1 Tax=Deinococcus ruber TaxID=1848197 RepID=A0A918FAP0_9DEIO|nr:hypothetical protein [Deinococcus ruber]GGR16995.1 hypothetical protein GCM10008957_32050 [Deinococcus ruber]